MALKVAGSQYLEILDDLARRAGEITLEYFQTDKLELEIKADESPVTIADKKTEEFLRAEIERLFPGDAVLGEEYGETPLGSSGRRWILDPIDGTKAYAAGCPIYGVMIGLEINGRLDAGVVNMPALGEVVVAERGYGCWWNGRRTGVSKVDKLEQSIVLTTDPLRPYRQGVGELWDKISQPARLVRTWGDCYGHLMVATGRAEVMMDPIMAPWDCAAVLPIVEEAGGTFRDFSNKSTAFGGAAVSTNSILWPTIQPWLPQP